MTGDLVENAGAGEEVELLRTDGDFTLGEFDSLRVLWLVCKGEVRNDRGVLTVAPCVGSDNRSDGRPSRSLRSCIQRTFSPCGSTRGVGGAPLL